ncbi:Uncharacterized protein TCAP_02243 [Tolypocladium capitatum]|uniref:Uncharacterized protein n=1 Tax=Tolypocladium capitatum TaxID=45235 RepID=A0A2K3QK05_9HYPO|nr:Uncharacterized protein TCAP_02243 [Tolypocladium capitatum]
MDTSANAANVDYNDYNTVVWSDSGESIDTSSTGEPTAAMLGNVTRSTRTRGRQRNMMMKCPLHRVFSARGTTTRISRMNVQRLPLHQSLVDSLAYCLLQHLPRTFQLWLIANWPEWFLPPTVILKRQKPGWREEFDREVNAYHQLESLQGDVIPQLYGQTLCCQGKATRRAMVLSDVGDMAFCEADFPPIDVHLLTNMLEDAYRAIAKFGLFQVDCKLDNCHLFDGKIVILDLEQLGPLPHDATTEQTVRSVTDYLVDWWEKRQSFLRDEEEEEEREAEKWRHMQQNVNGPCPRNEANVDL